MKSNEGRVPVPPFSLTRTMKKLYVDAETTGTDPKKHGLIQFSAVAVVDDVRVGSINLNIMPFTGIDEIDDGALEHNGVSREELFSGDRLIPKEAHYQICAFLGQFVNKFDKSDKFIWLGYRAGFDADFAREFFLKNGDSYYGSWFFTPPLCVMTLSAYILQKHRYKLENFKQITVFNFLYPEMATFWPEDGWHDSMFDIDRTIDIEDALRYYIRGKQIPQHHLLSEAVPHP